MTLWIDRGSGWEYEGYAVRELKTICPDPNLAFDLGPLTGVRIGSGEVTYGTVSVDTPWCHMVHSLVASKIPVVLKPRWPGFVVQVAGEKRRLNEFTAFTYWPGLPVVVPTPKSITVVYDPTDDAKRGYWVEDSDGKPIAAPPDVNLVHEFGHVEQALLGLLDADAPEVYPIGRENAYRQSRGLPMRKGYYGGTGLRAMKSGGSSGGDCFIATAAYGSEIDPNVEQLRRFRDDVLRQTRMGRRFFDEYWSHYYRLSPEIVRMMHENDGVREMVRWSLVSPIVGFLRMAIEYPEASTDSVPEPWRSYLEKMREEFQSWSDHIEPPISFADLPAEEAAEEIRITLSCLMWRSEARTAFLRDLVARGELPLDVTESQRSAIDALFRGDGRGDEEIEMIVGASGREVAV